jgi:hypothetical protein
VLSDGSSVSSSASNTAHISEYSPSKRERDACPWLIYRSNYLTSPFLESASEEGDIFQRDLLPLYNTPLSRIWDTVGNSICDLLDQHVTWSSLNPARVSSHDQLALEDGQGQGDLGFFILSIGVPPGSTNSETAHSVSQEILVILRENGVEDAVVEWEECVVERLLDTR